MCCIIRYLLVLIGKVKENEEEEEEVEVEDLGQWQSLCSVQVTGAYPILSVVDVRSYGAASSLSKAQVWRMFSVHQYAADTSCPHSYSSLHWLLTSLAG